jgi:hypothetical protein
MTFSAPAEEVPYTFGFEVLVNVAKTLIRGRKLSDPILGSFYYLVEQGGFDIEFRVSSGRVWGEPH